MKLHSVPIALSFAVLASAVPSQFSPHQVKENVAVPRGWVRDRRAPAHSLIELRIALPRPNWRELERHLYEVRSVPSSFLDVFVSG